MIIMANQNKALISLLSGVHGHCAVTRLLKCEHLYFFQLNLELCVSF